MSIAASFADLWNGTYIGVIQDALGNTGASLTMRDGQPGSAIISGTPTGLGLQLQAKQQAALVAQRTKPDTITLSPEAQAKLAGLLLATKLLASHTQAAQTRGAATRQDNPASGPPGLGIQASTKTVDPTDVAALTTENPTQVIKDALAAGQAALADTAGFYVLAESHPQMIDDLMVGLSDAERSSFMAAYTNRTLTLQSAADVPGWEYDAQTTLTGQGQSGGPTSAAATGVWGFAGKPPAGVGFASLDFGIGQLFVSWPASQTQGSVP